MKIYGNAASGNAYQPETPNLPRGDFGRVSHRPWCLDCKKKHDPDQLDGEGRCEKCARAAVSRAAAAERRAREEAERKAAAAAAPRPAPVRHAGSPSCTPQPRRPRRTEEVSRTVDHSAKIAKLVTQRTALATRLADVDEQLAALRAEHGTTVVTTRARAIRNHNGPVPMELPDDEIAAAYAAGATLTELAAKHGCSSPTIARALDRAGVERRAQTVDYTPALLEDVRRLYVDEELTQAQVAERLGVTLKVVQTAMERGGIEARQSASERSQAGLSVGRDGAVSLRERIADLGVPTRTIKEWAVDQGLVARIQRGVPAAALVEAYAAAHPEAVSA